MGYPVFATGDVLNASDMNAVGLWKVYDATFTGVSSVSLPNGTFTSDYRNYRVTYTLTVNTDADFFLRLRKNGSDNPAGAYNTMLAGVGSNGVASNSTADSATSWTFGEQDSVLDGYTAMFDLFQPMISGRTWAIGGLTMINKAATASVGRSGSWWHNVVDTYDSCSLISSIANSMTGVVRVYGYRN